MNNKKTKGNKKNGQSLVLPEKEKQPKGLFAIKCFLPLSALLIIYFFVTNKSFLVLGYPFSGSFAKILAAFDFLFIAILFFSLIKMNKLAPYLLYFHAILPLINDTTSYFLSRPKFNSLVDVTFSILFLQSVSLLLYRISLSDYFTTGFFSPKKDFAFTIFYFASYSIIIILLLSFIVRGAL